MANVIITGATQGIGKAVAEAFLTNGDDVFLTARTLADLERLQTQYRATYPHQQIHIAAADMNSRDGVLVFTQAVQAVWKQVDVLVNNAGWFAMNDLFAEEDGMLEEMMAVNVLAPYYLTKKLLPALQHERSAYIINLCSIASLQAYPGSHIYTISKFAMLGFTRSLRLGLKDSRIKVVAVMPGATQSRSWEGAPVDPDRLMPAADVAKAILACTQLGDNAVIEEIIIRPQLGDL